MAQGRVQQRRDRTVETTVIGECKYCHYIIALDPHYGRQGVKLEVLSLRYELVCEYCMVGADQSEWKPKVVEVYKYPGILGEAFPW